MNKLKLVLVAFIGVLAMLSGTQSLQAQSSDGQFPALFDTPTGSFVSNERADQILGDKVASLKQVIVNLTPGTSAFRTTEHAIFYYSTVQGEVASAQPIPQSIIKGLEYMADITVTNATAAEISVLREESINLLRQ